MGQIGLAVDGQVKWAGPVRHVVGAKGKQTWDFYAQKIAIKDDTGEIMTEISGNTAFELQVGDMVGVKGGVLGSYQKDGETKYTLEKAKFADRTPPKTQAASPNPAMSNKVEPVFDEYGQIVQVPPIQKQESNKVLQTYYNNKDMSRERGVALSYCLDVNKLNLGFKTDEEREGVYDLALEICEFVTTGKNPYPKNDAGSNG